MPNELNEPNFDPGTPAMVSYGSPDIVARLQSHNSRPIAGLHVNAILREEEWEEVDAAVVDVARTQLNMAADLINRGLVRRHTSLGVTLSQYDRLTDMGGANISMTPAVAGEEDGVGFERESVPLPFIHKDFRLDIRHMEASRRMGEGLDTTQIRVATRKVRDSLENLVANGTGSPVVGGAQIYGYTTKPQRISDTAVNFGGGDFGTAGNAYKTINGMINQLQTNGFFGPYGVYVAGTQYGQMKNLLSNDAARSELSVVMDQLPDVAFIKRADNLADGNVIVVALSADVVDMAFVTGWDFVVVQWVTLGGLVEHFKVVAVMAPRVKHEGSSTAKSGVAHATGA